MELKKIAMDEEKVKNGVTLHYDAERTCGAVIKKTNSPLFASTFIKEQTRAERVLRAAEENSLNKKLPEDKRAYWADQLSVLQREIQAKAMVKAVVVSIFGWTIDGKEIQSTSENIFAMLTDPGLEVFYQWCLVQSNASENFPVDTDSKDWERVAKKLALRSAGEEKTPKP